MHTKRHLSFLLMAVAVAAISIGVFSRGGAGNALAAPGDPGTATITVVAPGTQPLSTPFNVQINLSQFTPSVASPTWGGYDSELKYDSSILQVVGGLSGVTRGLCSAAGWGAVAYTPNVVTTCAFQSNTSTGTLDTVSFQCIANGTSTLTEVPRGSPDASFSGSALYDENAADFAMTLVSTSVDCGNVATSTPTNTNTPTGPTNTPTATRTPTPTLTPTNTPVAGTRTAIAAQTQTAQANFGGASTSTPPAATRTAVAALTQTAGPTDTPAPGQPTTAPPPPPPPPGGGGTTGPGGAPGGVITLPNTGSADSGRSAESLWLIVAGILLATFGAGLFVKSLRLR